VYEGSFFLTSLQTFVVVCVDDDSQFSMSEVESLIYISFMARMLNISSCAIWPLVLVPLKKILSVHLVISSLVTDFGGRFCFMSFLYVLVINPLSDV
jgi:hypothetical protein